MLKNESMSNQPFDYTMLKRERFQKVEINEGDSAKFMLVWEI